MNPQIQLHGVDANGVKTDASVTMRFSIEDFKQLESMLPPGSRFRWRVAEIVDKINLVTLDAGAR